MSIAVLIVTHGRLGRDLLDTAMQMLGSLSLCADVLEVSGQQDPEALRAEAAQRLRTLERGQGVLVLTDAYGSTPSNIAVAATRGGGRHRVVAGLNLPMLVRVFNYPDSTLDEAARIALEGGQRGVVLYEEND